MRKVFIFFVATFIWYIGFSQNIEIPQLENNQIIKHTAFTLSYNEQHEQANWVAYVLTSEQATTKCERSNSFKSDKQVSTESATYKDYKKSGYDRGHLAPAADMCLSSKTLQESFYYSNISPQKAGFNRGIWKKLEMQVRKWAIEKGKIYIVTGPVLTDSLDVIGPNNVSVPNYYYKVILYYNDSEIEGIGFVLLNETSKEPLLDLAVTIDDIEKMTGINFFYSLPDDKEKEVESVVNLNYWF